MDEARGVNVRAHLTLHGHDTLEVAISCDGCERTTKSVYRVSYDGKAAKYGLCGLCWSIAARQWGVHEEHERPTDP